MQTELVFAMDGSSSAPQRVGAWLVARGDLYTPRWVDRGDRTYLTMFVSTSIAEKMMSKVCGLHPSVRCIKHEQVPAA